jgi:Ion channel
VTDTLQQSDAGQGGPPPEGGSSGYRRSDFDRFSDSYGVVLLLIVTTIVLAGLLTGETWGRPIIVLVMGITLQVGLAASRVSPRLHRYAGALSSVMVVIAVVGLASGSERASSLAIAIMAGVLVVLLPWAIVRGITDQAEINVRTIAGALCIYLLAGLFFAFVYMAMDVFGGNDFFAQNVPYHPFDFIYFSFITMTTVGYGDFTPAGDTGRMLAVLEALLGQIYLVTIVALLVGNMGRQRERRRRQERARRIKSLRLRGRGAKAKAAEAAQQEAEDIDSDAEALRAAAEELIERADELDARTAELNEDVQEVAPPSDEGAGKTDEPA